MGFLDSLTPVGLAAGVIGGIGKIFGAGSANKKLEQLISQDPAYKANPIAAQRLSLAQSLLNARAPGAAYAQSNIYQNSANQEANISRNATSGTQALAAGAANNAQTNKNFLDLGDQEAKDYQRRYQNEVGAQEGEIQEGDKAYQDQVRRFGDIAQIRGMQNQNTQNAWQSLSNLGYSTANFGLSGGFSKIFGGGAQPNNGGAVGASVGQMGAAIPGMGVSYPSTYGS